MKRALVLVALAALALAPACGGSAGGDTPPTTNGPAAGIRPCPGDSNLWDCTFNPTTSEGER